MRILDRYILRQMAWPFALGLAVFTFLLIVPELMRYAEEYVSKGVSPLARRPADRDAPSVLPGAHDSDVRCCWRSWWPSAGCRPTGSSWRCRPAASASTGCSGPVALVATTSCLATAYVYMVLIPVGNQAFREITFNILASSAENEVKPRVFFDGFPNIVVYARELPQTGGWDGVFIADNRSGEGSSVYLARHGRAVVNRNAKTVEMVLEDWTQHSVDADGGYVVARALPRLVLTLNPAGMFPSGGIAKGLREMSVPELRERIASLRRRVSHRTMRSSSSTSGSRFRRPAWYSA